ncbi:MAG: hypothetical protein RMI78_05675, partial [Nitrososphaerota archaeon]|nr:hypothetical protein [Nitrososphaerota archaeon]
MNLSTYAIFPAFETKTGALYHLASIIVVAIIILMIFGRKNGSRREMDFLKPGQRRVKGASLRQNF